MGNPSLNPFWSLQEPSSWKLEQPCLESCEFEKNQEEAQMVNFFSEY